MKIDSVKNGSREILSLAMAAQNRGFIDASDRLLDLYEAAKNAKNKVDSLYRSESPHG